MRSRFRRWLARVHPPSVISSSIMVFPETEDPSADSLPLDWLREMVLAWLPLLVQEDCDLVLGLVGSRALAAAYCCCWNLLEGFLDVLVKRNLHFYNCSPGLLFREV